MKCPCNDTCMFLDRNQTKNFDFTFKGDALLVQKRFCVRKCSKKYKTRGGYERHQASKHSERADRQMPFDSAVLNEFVNNTVLKLLENKAHSEILRQELSYYLSLIHISEPRDQRGSRMPSSA